MKLCAEYSWAASLPRDAPVWGDSVLAGRKCYLCSADAFSFCYFCLKVKSGTLTTLSWKLKHWAASFIHKSECFQSPGEDERLWGLTAENLQLHTKSDKQGNMNWVHITTQFFTRSSEETRFVTQTPPCSRCTRCLHAIANVTLAKEPGSCKNNVCTEATGERMCLEII